MRGRLVGLALISSGLVCAQSVTGITNYGFEAGSLYGWTAFNSTPALSSSTVHTGKYSVQIGPSSGGGVWQTFRVSIGTAYTISAWVYDGAGTASLLLDDSVNAGSAQTAVASAQPGVWQLVSVPFTSQTGFIRVHLWQTGSGTVYWDDVSVEAPLGLTNPGFEAGTAQGWTSEGGATPVATAAPKHTGGYSLSMAAAASPSGANQTISTASNPSLTVSAWVLAPAGATAQLSVDDSVNSSSMETATATGPSGVWQYISVTWCQFTYTYVTPTNAMRIHLLQSGAGTVYWDDVSVTLINYASFFNPWGAYQYWGSTWKTPSGGSPLYTSSPTHSSNDAVTVVATASGTGLTNNLYWTTGQGGVASAWVMAPSGTTATMTLDDLQGHVITVAAPSTGTWQNISFPFTSTMSPNWPMQMRLWQTGSGTVTWSDVSVSSSGIANPGYAYDPLSYAGMNGTYVNGSFFQYTLPTINYTTFSGGSFIFNPPVSGTNPNDYEVRSTLYLNGGGGTYIHFLRANSSSVQPGTGSYISAEVVVPNTLTSYTMGTLNVNQCINGTVTQLAGTGISITNGMTLRTVIFGGNLWIYDSTNTLILALNLPMPLTTGSPGIGGYGQPTGSGFETYFVGHHDTVAPSAIAQNSVATSLTSTSASLRWSGATDDVNGVGVFASQVTRAGQQPVFVASSEFTDPTVQPGTAYTYTIQAVDYHGNIGPGITVTLTTPPAQSIDPRRVGISKLGSYWGGGGEQIDTLSGNLNFSLPLVTAQGRAGWSVPVGLSYNSQNWRQDNGLNWQLGGDVGFGFGWTAQIGSITPYYANWTNGPDHFVYTDGTGAQYVLSQNVNGVWSSQQSAYVWYDSNAQILHFRDGTFWVMGCTSAGSEADAGTLYPTIIEDTSGNQVIVTYDTGIGLPWAVAIYGAAAVTTPNTSSRILTIDDVRAPHPFTWSVTGTTYSFQYDRLNFATPHLTSITNTIGTAENYAFTYAPTTVTPPFGADPNFAGGGAQQLTTLRLGDYTNYLFAYDSAGASELQQVTFPTGGVLKWDYANDGYSGGRLLRAVSGRFLADDSAGLHNWSYGLARDNASGGTIHQTFTLTDASGNGAKTWNFTPPNSSTPWMTGLVSEFKQTGGSVGTVYTDDTYTWVQDAAGNPYIGTKTSVTDPGTGNAQTAKTTQVMDAYGNVVQSAIYPYNNTTTPLRTYSNTYVSSTGYVSSYVRNRLASTTLTTGGVTKTLVTNTYFTRDQNASPLPSYEMDQTPPIAAANRGLLQNSVTPAQTISYSYQNGLPTQVCAASGCVTSTASAATNYAAPDSITTPTYGQSLSYNSWLGVTTETGLNGEQLAMTYDSIGRPASATSPYGAVTGYSYSGWPSTYPPTLRRRRRSRGRTG